MIDMDNIYYKNDTLIPITVRITGPNTNLSVVFKGESSNQFHEASIYLNSKNFETVSNNSIVGKTLDNGKYRIFINTTSLPTGYYELKCVRQKYAESFGLRNFYLEINDDMR